MTSNQAQNDSRRTILVVEDDDALRDTVAYNLKGEGYAVLTAADGVAALDIGAAAAGFAGAARSDAAAARRAGRLPPAPRA